MTTALARRPATPAWWTAALFVGGCEVLGFLGSVLGGQHRSQPWIDDTRKPILWPPAWAFPAVWVVVNYPSLGIATWLIWQRCATQPVGDALRLFAVGMAFNVGFLPIVNRAKSRRLYVALDSLGLLLTLATTRAYARVTPAAAVAIGPLLVWSCFTTLIKVLWWRMQRTDDQAIPEK